MTDTVWFRFVEDHIGAVPSDRLCHVTFKGLRHRIATEWLAGGVDTRAIADILGQKTEPMPRWYSRDTVLAGKNLQAFPYLETAEAKAVRASKGVKPAKKTVIPDVETP